MGSFFFLTLVSKEQKSRFQSVSYPQKNRRTYMETYGDKIKPCIHVVCSPNELFCGAEQLSPTALGHSVRAFIS